MLKYLIIYNPWKFILIVFMIFLSFVIKILHINDREIVEVNKYHVIFQNEEIIVLFTGKSNSNQGEFGYEIFNKTPEMVIKDNFYIETKNTTLYYNYILFLKIITITLFVIFLVIIITELVDRSLDVFNLDNVYYKYYYSKVKYSYEGGYYYFYLNNRLLYTSKDLDFRGYQIKDYISNKNLFPVWEGTTQEQRDKKLTQILK